jgi:hypothetical protein
MFKFIISSIKRCPQALHHFILFYLEEEGVEVSFSNARIIV